ncbi:MAG: hypothetical protein QXN93_02660 [Methanomassiliicoccales archaeon]
MLTPDFSAYAARVLITAKIPKSGAEVEDLIKGIMSKCVVECVDAGATLIGHAKCIAESDNGNFMACSITSNDGKIRCRGVLQGEIRKVSLVINILLYGLKRAEIERIFETILWERIGPREFAVVIEDIDVHDHEHHEENHEHSHDHETA